MSATATLRAFFAARLWTVLLRRSDDAAAARPIQATALLAPGLTPADMAYLLDGSVFVDPLRGTSAPAGSATQAGCLK